MWSLLLFVDWSVKREANWAKISKAVWISGHGSGIEPGKLEHHSLRVGSVWYPVWSQKFQARVVNIGNGLCGCAPRASKSSGGAKLDTRGFGG